MPLIDMPLDALKSYMGTNPRPDDFDAYWDAGLAALDLTDPDITLAPATILSKSAECFHLTFTGVGGARQLRRCGISCRAALRVECEHAGGEWE
jgi:cephalosporin-C deacetylase